MKKLLGLLAAAGLVATSSTLVVQCSNHKYELKVADVSKTVANKLGAQKYESIEKVQEQLNKSTVTGIKSITASGIAESKDVKFTLVLVKGYTIDKETFELKDILAAPIVTPEVGTDGVQAALETVIKDKEFVSEAKVIEAAKTVKLTKGLVLDGVPTNAEQTLTIKVKADTGYKLTEGAKTSFSANWKLVEATPIDKVTTVAELEKDVKNVTFDSVKAAIDLVQAKKITGIQTINAVEKTTYVRASDHTLEVTVVAAEGFKLVDWDGKIQIAIKISNPDVEVTREQVQTELDKLAKTYDDNTAATNAVKAIDVTSFKVVDAVAKTRGFQNVTFFVTLEAKTGYILADDIKNGIDLTLSIGKEDIEITKEEVDDVFKKITGSFEDKVIATQAIKDVKDERFEIGKISVDEQHAQGYREVEFKFPIIPKKGYKLSNDLKNGTTLKLWIGDENDWKIQTDVMQEKLDQVIKGQEFENGDKAREAAFYNIKQPRGINFERNDITNLENTITLNIKPHKNFKFAEGAKTSFTANWKIVEAPAVALNTVITNTTVQVEHGKGKDTAAILVAVKEANAGLDESKVEIKIEADVITVESKDETVYTGNVTLTVTEKDENTEGGETFSFKTISNKYSN